MSAEEQVSELASSFLAPPASPATTPAATALAPEDIEDVFSTPLLSRGQFNRYALDLEPGTCAMICFMPDPSGTSHVMLDIPTGGRRVEVSDSTPPDAGPCPVGSLGRRETGVVLPA